ncbi:Transcriptional regulator OS=Streptomyces fumanus OX=67302 GN=GCM10018772_31350 PE=4 SV=1 [Streptomyces fumanus]
MRQVELGAAIGYSEEMVSSVERGRRVPARSSSTRRTRPSAADGKIAGMKEDVERARYPKNVRDLAKLEAEAVDLGAYEALHVYSLSQTEEYARALFVRCGDLRTRRRRSSGM